MLSRYMRPEGPWQRLRHCLNSGTVWTDGSRLDSREVGAACVWRSAEGWTGRRYHLVFDAEVFVIYRALHVLDQRQESGRRYTIFVDSTAAIDRIRSDAIGPGQRFAIASMEVCERVAAKDNAVTIRWVPAHAGVQGNEVADRYAKAAAGRSAPCADGDTPDELRWESSLSYMTGAATEARSQATTTWVSERIGARRYRPPPGRGLRRQHLRGTIKELAGRFYQFLSGHAATGSYLHDKIHRIDSDRCWWCDTGERQSRFHLVARCPAWRGQAAVMWKRTGRLCEWERPRALSVQLMFDGVRAAPAVLTFLRDTWVGRMISLAPRGGEGAEEETESEEEEGGPGPP